MPYPYLASYLFRWTHLTGSQELLTSCEQLHHGSCVPDLLAHGPHTFHALLRRLPDPLQFLRENPSRLDLRLCQFLDRAGEGPYRPFHTGCPDRPLHDPSRGTGTRVVLVFA